MSLILDALNRSESDRASPGAPPGLQSVHGPRDPAPLPLWRRLLWPALAVVFGLLALGLWFSGNRESPDPATEESPVAASPAPVSEPVPAAVAPAAGTPVVGTPAAITAGEEVPAPEVSSPEPAGPVAPSEPPAVDADVAALYREQSAAAPPEPEQANPAAPKPVEPKPVAPKPAQTPAPAAAAKPLDVDALARAAEAALEEGSLRQEPVVEHAAPFITELRQQTKDQIPTIFYSEHNWSSVPAERSVVLNRERFAEGQQVKPGLRLVEILPDSIVLDFQGTEFRLQSLNSWVNL